MRQFERDDVLRAAAGDADALLRVQRRKDVLKWNVQERRTALKYATPLWADHKAIDAVYTEARRLSAETGIKHDVDHIIPLQGKKVCGLHIPWNLRVITKAANVKKHASFGDEDVVGFLAELGYEVIYGVRNLKRAIKIGRGQPVLLVSPEGQVMLEVAHLHGEFVIGSASEASTLPLVAIARNDPLHTTGP